jgi:hypothetical protein
MSLRATLLAIRLLHPEIDGSEEAQAIEAAAKVAHVDPLELVALVEHESEFRRQAVSPDGEDHGLAQVRARHRPACRGQLQSAECEAEKRKLQIPSYNLGIVGQTIRLVKKGKPWKKKRSSAVWLAALAGTSNLRHPKVLEVLELAKKIKRASKLGSAAPCTCHGAS